MNGTVGKVVATDTRHTQFESHRKQGLLAIALKRRNKKVRFGLTSKTNHQVYHLFQFMMTT